MSQERYDIDETLDDIACTISDMNYLEGMKEYFENKGHNIPESFWTDPIALEMIAARRNSKGLNFQWYRCPWCKRVPKSAKREYVFQHMYGRMSAGCKDKLFSGCDRAPLDHRLLDEKNELVCPQKNIKGETRPEYFYIEPEEISPLIAVRSERFSRGKPYLTSRLKTPKNVVKKSIDSSQQSTGEPSQESPSKPAESEGSGSKDDQIESRGERILDRFERKIENFFQENCYHIPEGFWEHSTVMEIIECRRNFDVKSTELWYRCPWCKKTDSSALKKSITNHMFHQKRGEHENSKKFTKKGCPLMPEELKKYFECDKLDKLSESGQKKVYEERFVGPEEMIPVMILETDFFGRKLCDFDYVNDEKSLRKQKRKSDQSNLDISSVPSQSSQDKYSIRQYSTSKKHSKVMRVLHPSPTKPTGKSDESIDLSAGPSHRQEEDISSSPTSTKRSKGTSLHSPTPRNKPETPRKE